MNSIWLVLTGLAAFVVAYRLYGAFLAAKVAVVNDSRITPAHRLKDGVDYHPTRRLVLFGHHFSAIAGPGPLIGPVLAAQWGYFPGFAWIVLGACLAGAVQDFIILVASVRHEGRTLPKLARQLVGPVAGASTALATLFIVVAVLASVAMVVVNALGHSAWGLFTIIVTIPAALLTGLWMYKVRPGRVGEASILGVSLMLLGVILGKPFADSEYGPLLVLSGQTLSIMLMIYVAMASILPVWVLMCPRDYLSSYMKIGVIVVLAVGIFVAQPHLQMKAATPFLAGGGPVVSGAIWPFVCIVIMCGALSGFHALIASGTTPKMIDKESDMLPIGYGGMLLEGFVSLMALVAACALEPGDYFRINFQAILPAHIAQVTDSAERQRLFEQYADAQYAEMTRRVAAEHRWDLTPKQLPQLEEGVQERLEGRVGGAVTLAVGMAKVFASLPGMSQLMSYWYHFVLMFEALFILTLLETGTRVARFVFQETLSQFIPQATIAHQPNWGLNITMSVLVCGLWGGLLYIGNLETLWRMLGIANQLLASIALCVGTTYLLLYANKRRYALCTALPLLFVLATVFTAGIQSIHMWWHLSGKPDTKTTDVFLLKLASVLAAIMLVLSAVVVFDAARRWYGLLHRERSVAGVAPLPEPEVQV